MTKEEGQQKAKVIQAIAYMECSSRMKSGVKQVFDEAITTMAIRYEASDTGKVNDKLLEAKPRLHLPTQLNPHESNNSNHTQPQGQGEQKKEETPPEILDKLLDQTDITIDNLLTENLRGELLKQFRMRNRKLMKLLSRRSTLLRLIDIICKGTEDPQVVSAVIFAYVLFQEERSSTELLTADIPEVLGNNNYYRELGKKITNCP